MIFFNKQKKKPFIYLDNAAGTPIAPSALQAMQTHLESNFFNPGALYNEAFDVRDALSTARHTISGHISCRPQELFFCDGGTEANNLAIRGLVSVWQRKHPGELAHIITSSIEHSSVLETCRDLEKNNLAKVSYLPVDASGLVDMALLKKSITDKTVLVSMAYVNGEIGVIQDIRGLTKMIRHYRKHNQSVYPFVHTDAVQAVNYSPINVQKLGIDMMTFNASKIYGPKKIAALYKKPHVVIDPIITGGSQEFGLRAGTENVPYIVGFATAVDVARNISDSETDRLRHVQHYFIEELIKNMSDITINTDPEKSIPNIINISLPNISSEEIVLRLDAVGIKASVKSACKSGEEGDSHVIRALRNSNTQSIRFSMGRDTQKADIDYVVIELKRIVSAMREVFEKYYS